MRASVYSLHLFFWWGLLKIHPLFLSPFAVHLKTVTTLFVNWLYPNVKWEVKKKFICLFIHILNLCVPSFPFVLGSLYVSLLWASQKAKASREGTFLPCLTDQEITRMNPTHVRKHTDCYPGNKEKGPGGCIKFSSRQRLVPLVEIEEKWNKQLWGRRDSTN